MRMSIAPTLWKLTLRDGSVVEVWAHLYQGGHSADDDPLRQGDLEFGCIIDGGSDESATSELQPMDLSVRDGAVFVVARFPRDCVAGVESA